MVAISDDIFNCILLKKNIHISIKTSMEVATKDPIDKIPSLVQILAWHRTRDKPLSEPLTAYVDDAYMCHSTSMY